MKTIEEYMDTCEYVIVDRANNVLNGFNSFREADLYLANMCGYYNPSRVNIGRDAYGLNTIKVYDCNGNTLRLVCFSSNEYTVA